MWMKWLVSCDCGFQSVCPLMEKNKRIMEASWRERLKGKLGLVLMGGAMLSKSLIQFSVDGWGCVPSLLFTWGQTMVAGQVVWYSHLFQNFPQFIVIHTVKGFGIVSKAEIDVFLELFCFFHDPADVDNLISSFSAFSKSSLNIWKFTVLLKPSFENFEHYFTSVWGECNCMVVWAFFGIAFLWNWNKNTFSSPMATVEFSKFAGILSAALSQHHLLSFEIAQL